MKTRIMEKQFVCRVGERRGVKRSWDPRRLDSFMMIKISPPPPPPPSVRIDNY
jgi:hypothetical protein